MLEGIQGLTELQAVRLENKVAAGATQLDLEVENWAKRVDLDKLLMGSHTQCILGQLFGDFRYGLVIALPYRHNGDELTVAGEYGFDRPTDPSLNPYIWENLNLIWKSEVKRRLEESK